jgi:hypothetical protein
MRNETKIAETDKIRKGFEQNAIPISNGRTALGRAERKTLHGKYRK